MAVCLFLFESLIRRVCVQGLRSEIVNCDSMQLYKGFDVGTAKVSREVRSEVPHHLLDVFQVDEDCTSSRYVSLAVPIVS